MGQTKFVERWHSDAFESRDIALQIFDDLKKIKLFHILSLGGDLYQTKHLKQFQLMRMD